MKFLYFSFYMPPLLKDTDEIVGGAAVQWKSWIKGFRDSGHKFGLLTYKGASEYINKKLDFDIIESYSPYYGMKKFRLIYYQIPKLYMAIKEYNPDYLIQGGASAYTFILMLLAKIVKISFIHRIASDVDVNENIYTLGHNKKDVFLYRIGLKYSDFILAQNRYQYNKLKEKYPKKNIAVFHNPYHLETNEKDILARKEREYISWVGNFRKIKNLPALLHTAKQLSGTKFKIAGSEHDNLDQETISTLAELRHLQNVEFVGYLKRSEIKSFLSKSIIILNTSFNEGFSNTFLEAWSLGVPVVTTKNVNPDGIVNKYNLGKVADDYDDLPDLLKEIIDYDENEYNKLALHCFEYVKENHDPKMLATKLASYLKSNK